MPLRNGCSEEDISANIATLINEGKPRDQAVAIAYSMCDKAVPTTGIITRLNTGTIKSFTDMGYEGYLVRFGKPTDRDLDREWFSPQTYFMLQAGYPVKGAPVNYQHGMENRFGNIGIGLFDFVDEDEIGLFVRAQLHNQAQYEAMLRELGRVKGINLTDTQIRQKAEIACKAVKGLVTGVSLRQSMGADIAAFRINEETGHIDQCGIVHGALTPTPADDKNPLVRFKSALEYVYDFTDSRRTFSFPPVDPADVTASGLDELTPVDGIIPNGEGNPKSAEPTNPQSNSQVQSTEDVPMKTQHKETRLTKMTEDESGLLRSELHAALDSVLDKIGMATDNKEDMVDEMAQNLDKQDVQGEGVIEEAAAAIADELGQALDAEMPITEEVVQEVVADNLEQILPEEVKAYMKQLAERKSRRKNYVDHLFTDVQNQPTQSKKSQVGGMTQKVYGGLIGQAEPPSIGSFVKSAYNRNFKAQNPYIGPLGGYLLGQELSTTMLDPLRAEVVMFDMGVKSTTVNNIGIYTVPKMTTAPSAYRPGINQAITASDAHFDTITAFLRPIAAEAVIPRQLLYTAAIADLDKRIQEQLIKSIRLQIDKEILIGVGTVNSDTGAEIKGILRVLESDSTLSSTNVVTLATNGRVPNYVDMVNAETQISTGNVTLMDGTSGWVMHPRTRGSLRSLTTTTSEPLLAENWSQKPYQDVIGYRVKTTTQVPINITTGGNTDTSYVFFGEYSFAEYVMANDIEVIVDEMSLANQLQVRITAYTFSDFIVHYPEAFYVMKGVRAS